MGEKSASTSKKQEKNRKTQLLHSPSMESQQSGVTALHCALEVWKSLFQDTLDAESSHGFKSNYTNHWKMISL